MNRVNSRNGDKPWWQHHKYRCEIIIIIIIIIITWHNAVRGGPSHSHRGSASRILWRSVQRFQRYARGQTDGLITILRTPTGAEQLVHKSATDANSKSLYQHSTLKTADHHYISAPHWMNHSHYQCVSTNFYTSYQWVRLRLFSKQTKWTLSKVLGVWQYHCKMCFAA